MTKLSRCGEGSVVRCQMPVGIGLNRPMVWCTFLVGERERGGYRKVKPHGPQEMPPNPKCLMPDGYSYIPMDSDVEVINLVSDGLQ